MKSVVLPYYVRLKAVVRTDGRWNKNKFDLEWAKTIHKQQYASETLVVYYMSKSLIVKP